MSFGFSETLEKPLVNFSSTQNRAILVDDSDEEIEHNYLHGRNSHDSHKGGHSMSTRRRKSPRFVNKGKSATKPRKTTSRKVRVVNGRVVIKIGKAVQHLPPAHLIPHIPLGKLRIAAKKYIKSRDAIVKKTKKRQKGGKRKKKN
jgi:hypothetical protein